jgi:hypothetical protein
VGVRFQAEKDILELEKLYKSNKKHIFISRNDNSRLKSVVLRVLMGTH